MQPVDSAPCLPAPRKAPGSPASPSPSPDLGYPGRKAHTIQPVSLEEKRKQPARRQGGGRGDLKEALLEGDA